MGIIDEDEDEDEDVDVDVCFINLPSIVLQSGLRVRVRSASGHMAAQASYRDLPQKQQRSKEQYLLRAFTPDNSFNFYTNRTLYAIATITS